MHFRPFLSAAIAQLLSVTAVDALHLVDPTRDYMIDDVKRPPRRRRAPGNTTYPHSSTRQQARYARQIAAGQLSMKGAGK